MKTSYALLLLLTAVPLRAEETALERLKKAADSIEAAERAFDGSRGSRGRHVVSVSPDEGAPAWQTRREECPTREERHHDIYRDWERKEHRGRKHDEVVMNGAICGGGTAGWLLAAAHGLGWGIVGAALGIFAAILIVGFLYEEKTGREIIH